MSNEAIKARIESILNQGGDEYTRTQLAILACPSEASAAVVRAAERLIVELDIEERCSVRVDGLGTAYYSKAKPKVETSRVTFPTAFTKKARVH